MLSQEKFQSVQFLRNTFDVVKPIDTDNDFHASEAIFQNLDSLFNAFLFQILHSM